MDPSLSSGAAVKREDESRRLQGPDIPAHEDICQETDSSSMHVQVS